MFGTIEPDHSPYYNSVQDYDDLFSVSVLEQELWMKNETAAGGEEDIQPFMSPPEPTNCLYVFRRDDGLNDYSITEYCATVFKALEQWVAMNIPGERRGEDGEKHDFMKWSWFKLESEDERNRMYQAILSNQKERTQNKRRKAMDTTDGEELTKEDVNEFGKMEVNQVGKMLGEMGIVRDGKRKGRVYLDFRFSTHQWNKQGWRLTEARNLPRPDIKPWKWAVQPALPCV